MKNEKGGISVETEHIFPIIKRWLYSDKEIFLREIVSNASDAITKLQRLISLGEVKDIEFDGRITVSVSKKARTITVSDNGLGMDAEEVKKYIGNIALSGALEFIQKYEGESEGATDGIIGHFGLGFYSAFMVADKVDVISLSYRGGDSVKWECADDGSYEMTVPYEKSERGTDIVMHINAEGEEYLNASTLRAVLDKYCSFMPIEIYFVDDDAETKEGDEADEEKPINDTTPLWQKSPSECTDEEYKAFYHKVFGDFNDPLFWLHIKADYPLNFKGILYFPKLTHEFASLEGQVKLYYNQVFVADNIKEVIPEYLLMLRGVLDCPELPLNVSRSYLQANGYVDKISAHIVKKVADKINSLFKNDREKFEGMWSDIKTFCEYAALCDRKFYDKAKGSLLMEVVHGGFVTLSEYLESAKETNENTVYYSSDVELQAQYISMLEGKGIKVVKFAQMIDTQFVQMLEGANENVKFKRVDSDITDALKADGEVEHSEKLEKLFREAAGDDKLTVKCERLTDTSIPAILSFSEESRRMEDMFKIYAAGGMNMGGGFAAENSLVVNVENPLIKKLSESDGEINALLAKQIYSLAVLSQRRFDENEMKAFLAASYEVLSKLS
ncbi:MAG: molecular chaperone HtpG [Ruminococcaceae bacterium]|nr:molecular chaperone HtpG [Oscillospiraceae bacterium]